MTEGPFRSDMPTQTFWNLPIEKRQALIEIAVEEFANNDYDNASISRIVTRLGIAKGSIYQYFADKQDLFLYLLELSNQKRLEYVQREIPEPDMDFWKLLRWQIGASTRAALAYPLLTKLFYRALRGSLPFHNEILQNMKLTGMERWQQLVRHGIAQGNIRNDIDAELAAVLLNAVFTEIGTHMMTVLGVDNERLHELDSAVFQTPEVERIFDQMLTMLERGIGSNH
jgi:AcrR family transcriptional regulator